jgi:hypothetical protein
VSIRIQKKLTEKGKKTFFIYCVLKFPYLFLYTKRNDCCNKLRIFCCSSARSSFSPFAGLFLLLATGFLANLTGIGLIRKLGNLLVIGCAVGGAIYLTYDAVSYWQYYSHLRNTGSPGTVRVEDIQQERALKNDRSNVFIFYVYNARVNFRNESRIIAVGAADYEHTRTGQTRSFPSLSGSSFFSSATAA